MQPWTEKYRPHRFADVVGQRGAVAALQAELQSGRPSHVVLSGPSGTGKSTLAHIYAEAALCQAPLADGSACRDCRSCKAFVQGRNTNFYRINCGTDGAVEDVRELVGRILPYAPQLGKRHVVFFDEAQRLSIGARNALLLPTETTLEGVVFIFSLIDADVLPAALRDRCRPVTLVVPSLAERQALLQAITTKEGLALDRSGTALLASQSTSLRQIARRAESLAKDYGVALDVTKVRQLLLAEGPGPIMAYLEATIADDFEGAQRHLSEWQAAPSAKYDMVRLLLLHLKLGYLGRPARQDHDLPLGELLEPAACTELMNRLGAKAQWLGLSDIELMDQILEFWSFWPPLISEVELGTQIARFHDRLAIDGVGSEGVRQGPAHDRIAAMRRPAPAALNLRRPPKWSLPPSGGGYISGQQAEAVWEAASFLLLQYGLGFNARLEVRHGLLGITDERAAIKLMSDLARELGQSFTTWQKQKSARLHRITLHENLAGEGLVSSMVLHVPPGSEARTQAWIVDRFMGRYDRSNAAQACTIEFEAHRKEVGVIAGHWRLVRLALRGLDPEVRLGADKLIDLLVIPRRDRRAAGVIAGKRYSLSETLSRTAQSNAAREWLISPSAYRAQDWLSLTSGWEVRLREERLNRRAQHQQVMQAVEDDLAKASDSLTRQNLMMLSDEERSAYTTFLLNQIVK